MFKDGSTCMVSLADVLPLDLVKSGVPATALTDDCLDLPEVNGEPVCYKT